MFLELKEGCTSEWFEKIAVVDLHHPKKAIPHSIELLHPVKYDCWFQTSLSEHRRSHMHIKTYALRILFISYLK